jgi:hypothetical protein
MALDEATGRAVQLLRDVGLRHGRPPAPVPETDPWDDDDPLDPSVGAVVVELPGVPAVVVRLHRDGRDLVLVEDAVELEVPRPDTPAVVDSLLDGRARRRMHRAGPLRAILAVVVTTYAAPLPSDLVVPVGRVGSGRTYTAPLTDALAGGWLTTLPVEEAAPRR